MYVGKSEELCSAKTNDHNNLPKARMSLDNLLGS